MAKIVAPSSFDITVPVPTVLFFSSWSTYDMILTHWFAIHFVGWRNMCEIGNRRLSTFFSTWNWKRRHGLGRKNQTTEQIMQKRAAWTNCLLLFFFFSWTIFGLLNVIRGMLTCKILMFRCWHAISSRHSHSHTKSSHFYVVHSTLSLYSWSLRPFKVFTVIRRAEDRLWLICRSTWAKNRTSMRVSYWFRYVLRYQWNLPHESLRRS